MWIRTVTRTVENCCKYYSATAGGAQGVANARCGRLAAEGNLGAWTRSLLPPRCVLLSTAKLLCKRVVISMQYLTVMDNEVLKRKLPSRGPLPLGGSPLCLEVAQAYQACHPDLLRCSAKWRSAWAFRNSRSWVWISSRSGVRRIFIIACQLWNP